MTDFKITEDKISVIANELGVDPNSVAAFLPIFKEFYNEVRNQHLASVMRALELYVRRKHNKASFTVNWVFMPQGAVNTKYTVGLHWPWGYFIVIPFEYNEIHQIRTLVAHELGHLFYAIEHPGNVQDKKLNQKMANVFGVFTMLERNEFYKEKAPKMMRSTWIQVVNDFKQLDNRESGKVGVS